jgi:hypothetical protein
MGTTFKATAAAEGFFDLGHTDTIVYHGGSYIITTNSPFSGAEWTSDLSHFSSDSIYFSQMETIM